MHLKKKGSALISSMIILSIMSLMAAMYYKMTRYNLKFTYLNYNHTDRYDLSEEENHVIYKFANKINMKMKENEEENVNEALRSITLDEIDGYKIRYNSDKDNFILEYPKDYENKVYKTLEYKISENKLILIPKYVFCEEDINFVNR